MMRGRPPTGSRGGSGIVGPQIVERPMTQHGLGGMKQENFTILLLQTWFRTGRELARSGRFENFSEFRPYIGGSV